MEEERVALSSEAISYTIEGLLPDTEYTASVSAFTSQGSGPVQQVVVKTSALAGGSNIYVWMDYLLT